MTSRFLLSAVVMLAAAGPALSADKADFQGAWVVISINGKELPAEARGKLQVVFSGDNVTVKDQSRKEEAATFKLDPSKNPKAIDIMPKGEKPVLGIYQLDGKSLKLCWIKGGGKRPTKFSTEGGQTLFVMERGK